jgi:glyoxylase-like metal-dependent hydrolase (beta-lactamase superfamily II)
LYKKIFPDLYRIEVPLPNSPLKALNSYLIKGDDRDLLIDTGLNLEECRHVLITSLDELHVDLTKIDIFLTHLHSDHVGLVEYVATKTSTVYLGYRDKGMINNIGRWDVTLSFFLSNGFPRDELEKAIAGHQGRRHGPEHGIDFTTVGEGDRINAGDYHFTCIETPGHSPGHTCLYEPQKKILFTGDHILFDISPNITYWPGVENPLKEYLASLEKVYPLDVELALPGHRSMMNNHKKRVSELREHHQARLDEIITALKEGDKTAYEIAPYVKWDIVHDSWETFPSAQKWFAIGETLAHIEYLEDKGTVNRKTRGDIIFYSLS